MQCNSSSFQKAQLSWTCGLMEKGAKVPSVNIISEKRLQRNAMNSANSGSHLRMTSTLLWLGFLEVNSQYSFTTTSLKSYKSNMGVEVWKMKKSWGRCVLWNQKHFKPSNRKGDYPSPLIWNNKSVFKALLHARQKQWRHCSCQYH